MDTVEVPDAPFWNFEKGVYTGIIIATGVIVAIAYGVYKIITAGKNL